MAAKKNEVQKLLELAGDFVTKRNGDWDHAEWEGFLKKAEKISAVSDDQGKRNLGNILEAAKFFYQRADIEPSKPSKTKAKSKPKAAAKKKPAKKKAAAKKPAK